MAREAHAERAQRKISVEEKQPSSFPSLPGPKQCSLSWPNQGFGASCYTYAT
ncbi:hypothetical protein AB3S75_033457 [Citrus x aurantiifolia]